VEGLLHWEENEPRRDSTAFYDNHRADAAKEAAKGVDFPKVAKPPFSLAESFQNSPSRSHLAKAGDDTLHGGAYLASKLGLSPDLKAGSGEDEASMSEDDLIQPIPILQQTFGAYCDEPVDFFRALAPFFTERIVPSGTTLWKQRDRADGLYVIESGSLRATYSYDDHRELIQETMVALTIAGDLSTLSDTRRNATVVAERDSVLWKMDMEGLERLEKEKQDVAQRFVRNVLKGERTSQSRVEWILTNVGQ